MSHLRNIIIHIVTYLNGHYDCLTCIASVTVICERINAYICELFRTYFSLRNNIISHKDVFSNEERNNTN